MGTLPKVTQAVSKRWADKFLQNKFLLDGIADQIYWITDRI